MSKSKKFVPPIDLPNGAQLFTIEDAARYIMKMPAKQRTKPEWEFAGRCVVNVINGEDLEMHARLAFTRALAGIQPGSLRPKPPRDPSKDHYSTFRNTRKRDPWR